MELNRGILLEDFRQIAAAPLPWSEFAGARVLVTGATGFIAAYLIETLLYLNDHVLEHPMEVMGLARSREKVEKRFGSLVSRPDLKFLIQDVSVPTDITGPVDFIVHAASLASPKFYRTNPVDTMLPNMIGTYHLLRLAQAAGTRKFVFLSSGEAVGAFAKHPVEPIKESDYGSIDHLDLRSVYAEGKRAGEALCGAWWSQYALPTVSVRLSHTYGPGMDFADGRVFADFVANVVRGQDIEIKSAGLAVRPFCYLADATLGLLVLLLKGAGGQVYNLANDEAYMSVRDLATTIAELFPERNIKVNMAPIPVSSGPSVMDLKVPINTGKIRALGWAPKITIPDGFKRTIRSYGI
ncbi:MAG TPA: NAD-dependent epimerase/dehydratase family protein [Lacunisphaera sp.]|jgi:nucleoside-diphosphate-sugar epimerase